MKNNNKKVVVGISGGVDSAVSALLLIKQGYEVIGMFMRNWDSNLNNDILGNKNLENKEICSQEQDYNDAIKVCQQLGIELHRVDFIKEYWDNVFEKFIIEYKKGRTPNPDILCNKYIKFNFFLKKAKELFNCDYIAMGHYAGVAYNDLTKQFELKKGYDENKDQSYFLDRLNQDVLKQVLFPLHQFNKKDVREIAIKNKLVVAQKKDSTGICFIGERNFTQFLQNYIPNQPGKIIDIDTGKQIGEHIGVMYYTLGQRKGLNLGGYKEPYYVAQKDVKNKILYCAKLSNEKYLYTKECIVEDLNWIVDLNKYFNNKKDFICNAKFRYRQIDCPVKLQIKQDKLIVKFLNKQRAVTPGQEAVFYLNDTCLGGGVIC